MLTENDLHHCCVQWTIRTKRCRVEVRGLYEERTEGIQLMEVYTTKEAVYGANIYSSKVLFERNRKFRQRRFH